MEVTYTFQLLVTELSLGVLIAITVELVETRVAIEFVPAEATTTIFQTEPGIFIGFTVKLAPENSDGPQMFKTSSPPEARLRAYVSKVAQTPVLLAPYCGIMLLMRKVASLSVTEVVRSAEGHM